MAIKYTPYFLLAFLAGVGVRSVFNVPQEWMIGGLGLVVGFLATAKVAGKISVLRDGRPQPLAPSPYLPAEAALQALQAGEGEGEKKEMLSRSWGRGYVAVLVTLTFFLLGALRFSIFENNVAKDGLRNYYGKEKTLQGIVISSEPKPNSSRFVLETDLGRILVVSRIYPQYKYGDQLEVNGKVEEPENYAGFDVKKYLAKDKIYSQMVFPEIKKINEVGGSRILGILFSIREKFERELKNVLPEPHASLADGMLLGREGVLPAGILEAFRKTSTIHILVLSGYNITIVGNAILAFFGFLLPSIYAWGISIFGILIFTLMTGAEPAAVRAAIMALIGLLALRVGRKNLSLLSLLWAAFFMILWNPMYLRFDRGFQLSFMATLGLILLAGFFQKKFWFLPKFLGIRETAAASASAQLFVLPLLISWGNAVSIFSLPANILVVTAVPAVMLFGFLGAAAGFISQLFGQIVASPSYLLISYQLFIVKLFAGII